MPTLTCLAWLSLVALLAGVGALQAKTIDVRIENLAYLPSIIMAEQGDIIKWINNDPFDHTATVDGVVIQAGATVQQQLEKLDSASFFCRFHPTMTGVLTVKSQ